ncbi:essential protein Yae1 [Histoplasma capsulatum]|uniref:Protein YAE1 n=1 Tax=Ajellomyces capsulatus TaxID=5037 RepID=A0A8A1M6R6_AJECA|nr:essential protein Yae1 [Histoplasma capsulatum]
MGTSAESHSPSEQSRPPSPLDPDSSTPPPQSSTTTSAPSSPPHLPPQQPSPSVWDDIFSASPLLQNSPDNSVVQPYRLDGEPSDLPFLRRQHVTAGYRDGISVAKGEHVQRGFDAGFPVGAELGLRIGAVLGVLEGLVKATATATSATRRAGRGGNRGDDEDIQGNGSLRGPWGDIAALFEKAKKELTVQNVFSAAVPDVGGEAGQTGNEGEREWVDPCVRLAKAGDEAIARQYESQIGPEPTEITKPK